MQKGRKSDRERERERDERTAQGKERMIKEEAMDE